jgi:phosphotransferase system enzyme I (PtsI)
VPSIIAAHDLTPSDTASLDPKLTLGFCTAAGGLTSHTTILARTLGIPAVVGVGVNALSELENDMQVVLDGGAGVLVLNPSGDEIHRYEKQQTVLAERYRNLAAQAAQPAMMKDGTRVVVAANIGSIETAQQAVELGAEGIGLLRTEFLYLEETKPPTEDEQVDVYARIFDSMGDRLVIVRTLDLGGDKPPSFLKFDAEMNPFLGWRAIRICLDEPDLFKTQLRAILRAGHSHNVSIMFPMINSLDELLQAKQVLAESKSDLGQEGLVYNEDVSVGIMVETPSAVIIADQLAAECDFLSIGTNDLTQYLLAVDRTNEKVSDLFQPLHPAVLRAIEMTINAGHNQDIWVGMCGELAGMKKAIPILLGLGLDEFSMVPRAIPEAKWLISQLCIEEARTISDHVLTLSSAKQVEDYMEEELNTLGIG